jgi:phosphohistidine phosphatase
MAPRLASHGVRPSLIITSSAKRAQQTAKLLAREIVYPIEFIHTEKSLYLADPATILEVIETQEDTFSDIVICCHNPGISNLANQLSYQVINHMPTCGMVIIAADTNLWSEIASSSRTLIGFEYPKKPE